ncbi:hypothetical protein [Lactococcus allomyrinae]|uniref:Uncharacterized protein n=1 Tax=Lactococcus allomyrinae TaxID=2419773 RepID=A0A387BFT8_9LACT|nr:hypothetical protein [Lactococcus allomyrinae]AYF99779.1 hypothetical protein D7I46_00960 [Lactococcus allomyrinae]
MSVEKRHSASAVLRNQEHFFQLDERLLLVFSPEQYMFINRLDFWIQQKLQAQLANGEPVRGWVNTENRMYIFKTLKPSQHQTIPSWLEEFYHFSESSFNRVVKSLVSAGIVLKHNDKNKLARDKTLWYSLDYEALDRYYSEKFIERWQEVIVTRVTWELKKWLDFQPNVENSSLTNVQLRKKLFDSNAKVIAKQRAEELVLEFSDFNEQVIKDEVTEAVNKILTQLEQEFLGVVPCCQNDNMSDTNGSDGENEKINEKKAGKPHEQSCCQNDSMEAVKMAAALTIYNQPGITKNYDTNRYVNLDDLPNNFIQGVNHLFLTPKTVGQLSHFGEEAKALQDIIFRAKLKVEKEYHEQLKLRFPDREKSRIEGEFWQDDLENEVQKLIFVIKESRRKEKPIQNIEAFFTAMMENFWLAALVIDLNCSYSWKENAKYQAEEEGKNFLHAYFSKFDKAELKEELSNFSKEDAQRLSTNEIWI